MNKSHIALMESIKNIQVTLLAANHAVCDNTWQENGYLAPFYKLFLIKEGGGFFTYDKTTIELLPNQLILIPSNTLQKYELKEHKLLSKDWCHFYLRHEHNDLFNTLTPLVQQSLTNIDFIRIEELFSKMINEFSKNTPSSYFEANAALLQIIAWLIKSASSDSIHETDPSLKLMNQIIYLIEKHIEENITLSFLANRTHYSKAHLLSFFKKQIGLTPKQFIIEHKIRLATHYLDDPSLSIQSIANRLGYSSPYHFSNTFKKHTGYSPSAYRKKDY